MRTYRKTAHLKLVPPADDPLRQCLDELALSIAKSLSGTGADEAPISERIAGLKALTGYWQVTRLHAPSAEPEHAENAFDRFRREQSAAKDKAGTGQRAAGN